MGTRGPVGKRAEQRMGHPRESAEASATTEVAMDGEVLVPELGIPDAHPMVADFYESLKSSGQAQFYEPSDWEYARFVLSMMDDLLKSEKRSSTMFGEINSALTSLLVSEGDRRRVKMEVNRKGTTQDEEQAQVSRMDDYRKAALGGA